MRFRTISGIRPDHLPIQVVDQVRCSIHLDPFLSLRAASGYTNLSVRSLRGWLTHPERPLPCYRVNGKILLRRSEVDHWLAGFREVGPQDVDAMVQAIVHDLQGDPNYELGGQPTKVSEKKRTGARTMKLVAAGLHNGAG